MPSFCTILGLNKRAVIYRYSGSVEMAHAGEFEPRIMAFLSWLDAVERIDTLILEIRHVQETIVSQLRVPELYEPFRYEDYYLWGRFSRPTSLGAPHTTDIDSKDNNL